MDFSAAPPRSGLDYGAERRVLGHNGSAFLFRLIAAHVAELTRPFNEAALPVRTFLNGCGLVAERVNRSPGQLCGLASASSFGRLRWRGPCIAESLPDEPSNGFRTGRFGTLLSPSSCR